MKATELRIGNYVECVDGIDQISEIRETGVKLLKFNAHEPENLIHYFDWIKPLPITQECLERFGFVYDNDEDELILDDKLGVSLMCAHDSIVYYKGNLEPLWVDVLLNIEHVHQLQNLYFALTGNELTIQP